METKHDPTQGSEGNALRRATEAREGNEGNGRKEATVGLTRRKATDRG